MANGYGSSPSSSRKSNVDSQGKKAPPGYHYMPDGSLMSDKEHEELYESKSKMDAEAVELIPKSIQEHGCHNASRGKSASSMPLPVFRICAYNLVPTYAVNNTQDWISVPYSQSNPWMIAKITNSFFGNTPSGFMNFFADISAQVGGLAVGETVEISNNMLQSNTTSSGGGVCLSSISGGAVSGIANKFCVEYLGMHQHPSVGTMSPIPAPNYTGFFYDWDGSFISFLPFVHSFLKWDCCKGRLIVSTVYGCMDSNSPNYNPLATVDDGSCYPCDCTYSGGFWCETHNHLPVAGYSPLPPVWIGTLSTLSNFIDSMWNGFTNNGCQYLENRILLWTSQLPNITNANHLTQKQGKINWATAVLDNCDCNPTDFCYEIGDVGPGGGIVFSTPMTGGNSTSYYYEMHIEDLAYCSNNWSEITHLNPIIQPPNPMDIRCEEGVFDWSLWNAQQIPFAEWGGYNYNVGQLDVFPQHVGIGLANTTAQIASSSIQAVVFPSNETASSLCDNLTAFNAPNPTGFSDWYLPSAGEWELINQNIGPSTTFAAISNLEVSPNTGFGYAGYGPILEKYPRYYWTSSALINPLPTAPDTNHLQAYAYSISTSNTVPQGVVVADRCSALGVRAIRRFKCPTILPPPPPDPSFYNYRDAAYGHLGWTAALATVTTPGTCTSGQMHTQTWEKDVIGLDEFFIGLATTDVLGNIYNKTDFENVNNPDGYTISIWDNNKNYLGKWHYNNAQSVQYSYANLLSTPGIKRVVEISPSVVECVGDRFFNEPELPKIINIKLTNVTHLEGPNPKVRYGSNSPYYLNHAQTIAHGVVPNNYTVDYETGTNGGHTSSYCFVKFECAATLSNQFENIHTGPNTDPQNSHVICTGKWVRLGQIQGSATSIFSPQQYSTPPFTFNQASMDVYNEQWTGNTNVNGTGPQSRHVSGRIGIGTGDVNSFAFGHSNWLASQLQADIINPVYGTPNNWNEPFLQNLYVGQTWPLHYLHPWFASAPPSSALTSNGITWYPDLQTAINTTTANQNGPCYTGNDSLNIINI